jgi:quercetin dioxygenase-like cupin family protein
MKATATIQTDNDLTRVTEWRFAPGAATGYHRHEHDYVIVPMTTGRLELRGPDGVHLGEMAAGQSYFRSAGVEHDVKNINDHEFIFIEIEFKTTGVAS